MSLVRSKSVALIKSGQALSLRPDLLKKKIWAEELGKLVDEVGSFPDIDALNIMREELSDLLPRVKNASIDAKKLKQKKKASSTGSKSVKKTRLTKLVENDPILSLFEFYNDCRVVASASIGQVVRGMIGGLSICYMFTITCTDIFDAVFSPVQSKNTTWACP